MIRSARALLQASEQRRVLLILLGSCCAALLEMISLGGVPAFVALLAEPAWLSAQLPDGRLRELVLGTDVAVLTVAGALALMVLFLLKNAFVGSLIYTEGKVLRDVTVRLADLLFLKYLRQPYPFHLQRNPAELIRNVSSEVARAVDVLRGGMRIVRETLVLAVVFVLLVWLDPYVSALVFGLLGIASAAFLLANRNRLALRGLLVQQHRAQQLQTATQGFGVIKEARILGREPFLRDAFRAEVWGKERHEHMQRVLMEAPRLFLEVVAVAAVLVVAIVVVTIDRPAQTMLPVLALLGASAMRLVPAFNGLTSSIGYVRYEGVALELVRRELDEDGDTAARPSAVAPSTRHMVGRLREHIQVRDVHYAYPGADRPALHGASVEIVSGEAVAIVGVSGAGKSTLADVILGLLPPDAGSVLVDDIDIQGDLPGWQHQIGYVPQDVYLLDATIRSNITFGLADADVDADALRRALELAQLADFVATLPLGLDTVIGNRGVRLSGGQRQRLGIARSLYHDPAVVLLDEATSALDMETEHALMTAISSLRGVRTLLVIAHRLTTVAQCDRVILVERGRVVDSGTWECMAERYELLRAGAWTRSRPVSA
jgi:ATP-binding cassette, subfamily B, bacterial PglK